MLYFSASPKAEALRPRNVGRELNPFPVQSERSASPLLLRLDLPLLQRFDFDGLKQALLAKRWLARVLREAKEALWHSLSQKGKLTGWKEGSASWGGVMFQNEALRWWYFRDGPGRYFRKERFRLEVQFPAKRF